MRGRHVIPVLVGLMLVLAGCSYSDTQSDEVACVWNGGPFDDSNFRDYHAPGSGRDSNGSFSETKYFPTNIRNYIVSLDPNEGDVAKPDFIETTVSGVTMRFEPKTYFYFNHKLADVAGKQMPLSCAWWQEQGKRFAAEDFNTKGGNWQANYLPQQFRPALNDVFQRATQAMATKVDGLPKALYLNEPVKIDGATVPARDYLASQVGAELPKSLQSLLGREFFCGNAILPDSTEACAPFRVLLDKLPVLTDGSLAGSFSAAQTAAATRAAVIAKAREESTQAREQATITAEQAKAVAKSNADRAAAEAEQAQRLAEAEVTKARAQQTVQLAQAEIETIRARIAVADCVAAGATGQSCALLKAALAGKFPSVIGGSAVVQVPTQ